MPMGPFAMHDMAGVDVSYRIRRRQAPTRNSNMRVSNILNLIAEQGRHGQKTNAGFYKYEAGARDSLLRSLSRTNHVPDLQ